MKIPLMQFEKKAKIVKENETYSVYDIGLLKNIMVSMTVLHAGKETSGHTHDNADEVYFFLNHGGSMQLDNKKFDVCKHDIILVPVGCFHKVFNQAGKDLRFLCVFEKYKGRD